MNPKISIIVPVYNVEPYLRKCIDSILNQTFKDFELILVNDGSTDRSGEICNDYAQIDSRIIVIHKENGGQSSARNIALEIARGNYIGFVDSDDWIEPDMYMKLFNSCTSKNADIGIIGVRECDEIGNIYHIHIPNPSYDFEEILKRAHPWNKLFNKKLFDLYEFRFKNGMYYEDLELIPKIFINAKKIIVLGDIGYNYLQRSDSTVHRKDEKVLDHLRAYLSLYHYINSKEEWRLKYSKSFTRGLIYFKSYYFDLLSQFPNSFIIRHSYFIYTSLIKLKAINLKDFLIIPYLKFYTYNPFKK